MKVYAHLMIHGEDSQYFYYTAETEEMNAFSLEQIFAMLQRWW